ncbi:hypothetical protein DSOL_5240 [Desulfosporosinus metallidurans]|uniref:Uncharacterized protein n=2 Tax=Desulfosporosinus metallidurans TaxID=1888891 RepID=A0A1Q8QEH8_9FIRM|nr:hypothetical protein DSOL_5240 [Desulfosporosinus metallidurans]
MPSLPQVFLHPMDPIQDWYESEQFRTYTSTYFQSLETGVITSALLYFLHVPPKPSFFAGVVASYQSFYSGISGAQTGYEIVYYYWCPSGIPSSPLKTGEVEYAESFLKNGKYVYSATTKEGKSTIEPVNGTVKITNENTKKVKYSKPVVTSNTTAKKSTVTPLIAGWDAYGPIRYSSYAIDTTYASVLAGCLASLYGGPITGVLVTIAGAFIALHTPDVWYIETNYVDSYDDTHFMVKTEYYAYSDYTNYQGESDFIYWT